MTSSSAPRARLLVVLGLFLSLVLAVGTVYGVLTWMDAMRRAEVSLHVRAVLDEQSDAWNEGDLERFLATYWDSEELVFFSGGTISNGHRAVAERYRKNYQAEGKEMGRLSFSDIEVTPVAADAGLARARWKLVTSKETVEGLFTLLVRKLPGGWKIVHDHTSRADPVKK